MNKNFHSKILSLLIMIFFVTFPFIESIAQCYMITSDKFNRILIESGASPIPTRQGPFTTEECQSRVESNAEISKG